MKRIIIVIALIMTSAASYAQIKSASLTASGLTCSMCSKSIYKALVKLPAVQSVQEDIEHSSFEIVFKPGSIVAPDDIKKAVTGAGFAIASLKMTANFANTNVENDAHVIIEGNTYHFLNVSKQTLSGDKAFKLVDKNFVSQAENRKYKKYTNMKCFETGMSENCCHSDNKKGNRIYHVTL
jgi:copper chaperone CopZ